MSGKNHCCCIKDPPFEFESSHQPFVCKYCLLFTCCIHKIYSEIMSKIARLQMIAQSGRSGHTDCFLVKYIFPTEWHLASQFIKALPKSFLPVVVVVVAFQIFWSKLCSYSGCCIERRFKQFDRLVINLVTYLTIVWK